MTAPLRERLEDLLTRLDSPADRTLVQAAIRELAEREKDAERYRKARDGLRDLLKPNGPLMTYAEVDAYYDTAIKERK